MREQNTLEKILPLGLIATRAYMMAQGMERHGFDNAVKSGKIKAVSRGVYVREGLSLNWQGVMTSLNLMSEKQPVYVGGLSALEYSGLNHYIKNKTVIDVYSEMKKPKWLDLLAIDVDFVWHSSNRIWKGLTTENFDDFTQVKWRNDLSPYLVASMEQACLEVLADVPNELSFEHADLLFQSLSSLSPRRLNKLLSQCNHIKAKRLFFWFAKRHDYQWSKKLNRSDYDLGSGKRVIAERGRLDKELMITVPYSW